MKPLLVCNWKCNPRDVASAAKLAETIEVIASEKRNVQVVIAPPFPFLDVVSGMVETSKLGAQDVFWGDLGAYTGEVSWQQLKSLGVSYVIVGHSERRMLLGEDDAMIAKKVSAALGAGIKVILCVGEHERKGKTLAPAKEFVLNQFKAATKGIQKGDKRIQNLVVAYEPVWAIGTGLADSPAGAGEIASELEKAMKRKGIETPVVLYGGSVNAKNCSAFLAEESISGALIGGASLKPVEFRKMVQKL
jgi:triosephosphate isomerase